MDNTRFDDRVAKIAADTVEAVGAIAGDARSQAEETAGQTVAAARQAYGHARDQARGATAAVAASADQHPGIALLAVGLICGAFGFLLARR